ncbi:MAG: isocitrate lyase/phosphoenolpyruvate mutase family protein [Maricaulaceae bacterium]|nr:isocitrate lyase/phosphoenolpyruvate mutase family protein [Maricaulaceae bacterium]
MTEQAARARAFAALHVKGDPLILFNAWDAGSARVIAAAGAKAIATGSWSVAAAHGHDDGEALPLDLALANLARIAATVDLPVTLDFETGYGASPEAVGESAGRAIEAGAIGFNIEDRMIAGEGLRSIQDQAARLAAVRVAADRAGVPAFINARTDLFLKAPAERHDAALADAALERAQAYAVAGANGLFVPGLTGEGLIARICETSPLPVNVMMKPGAPSARRLSELGVARISYGPGPWRVAMTALKEAAAAAHGEN